MRSVYQRLPRPFIAAAPMEDITDTAFRRVLRGVAAPDLMYTEFAWVKGLCSNKPTRARNRLRFHPEERPLIAQLWGRDPEAFECAAGVAAQLGFDGIDINMGCSVPKVLKRGSGAGLIATPELAAAVISAARRGAPSLPLSVKTRLGLNEPRIEEWCGFLLRQDLDALCVHARTAAQGYGGAANWEAINEVLALRDRLAPRTVIIGNGDLISAGSALRLHPRYPVDGLMIGRAMLRNPFAMSRDSEGEELPTEATGLELYRRHITLHREIWQERRSAGVLKRFVGTYLAGTSQHAELRRALLLSRDHDEMLALITQAQAQRGTVLPA